MKLFAGWRALRPAIMMVAGALGTIGLAPEPIVVAIVENAESVVFGLVGVWGAVAQFRNFREDRKAE